MAGVAGGAILSGMSSVGRTETKTRASAGLFVVVKVSVAHDRWPDCKSF